MAISEAELAQRVARLEAIDEIKRLKARYCAYCDDDYDPEGIAGLFVEDGLWDGERFKSRGFSRASPARSCLPRTSR